MNRAGRGLILVATAAVCLATVASTAVGRPATGSRAELIDCHCYSLFRVDAAGGKRRLLSRGASRDLFDVSRAQTHILYSHRSQDLSTSTLEGTAGRVLATGTDITFARFSPNGTKVLYIDNAVAPPCAQASIYITRSDGAAKQPLISSCGGYDAAWSPDSRRVAFIKMSPARRGTQFLALAFANGTGQATLASGANFSDLAWSPQGDRLAYVAGASHPTIHILRLNDRKDITIAAGRAPQWSPDGKEIAFLWQRSGSAREAVALIKSDGTHARTIDPKAVDPYGQGLGWAPNSKQIVYRRTATATCGCRTDLYIEAVDGTRRRPLYRGAEHEEFGPLYWSRDGRTITYTSLVQHGQ